MYDVGGPGFWEDGLRNVYKYIISSGSWLYCLVYGGEIFQFMLSILARIGPGG